MGRNRTYQKKLYPNNLLLIPARMLDDLDIHPGDILTLESDPTTGTITISKGDQNNGNEKE